MELEYTFLCLSNFRCASSASASILVEYIFLGCSPSINSHSQQNVSIYNFSKSNYDN